MQPLEVTLIVAASRNMGIGFQGAMPWKGLRKEMQYFARTTTQLPPHVSSIAHCTHSNMFDKYKSHNANMKQLTDVGDD